uniref:Uncharacterized protein n=1 Tax=Anguilla anguilla TaxID=7936 RepID=A0A0E9QS34_ANGAN
MRCGLLRLELKPTGW